MSAAKLDELNHAEESAGRLVGVLEGDCLHPRRLWIRARQKCTCRIFAEVTGSRWRAGS